MAGGWPPFADGMPPVAGVLTRQSFYCFIVESETQRDPGSPRQTRRRVALHHRDPPRLLAPSPYPPSHRLCRLRQRPRPSRLGPAVSYPGGRTKQISLSAEQKPMVQQWLRNYRKLKDSLERICELNQQLLRPEKIA